MRVILFVSIALTTQTVIAQNHQSYLPELLKRVAQNYPSIKAKEAKIKAAAFYLNAAKKDYSPEVIVGDQYQYATDNGLEGSYYSNEGTTISTSGGMRDHNIFQGTFGSYTSLMVNWHAFDFGKVRASVQLAETGVQLAKADYENAVFQQQIKVTDAYLLAALSQKLVSVQQNNLKRAEAFRQFIISHTLSGLLPGVDSSLANAEVAKAELALLQSQQEVAQRKLQLEALSAVPADSIQIDTTVFLQKAPSFTATITDAIGQHPALLLAKKQLAIELNRLEVVKKAALPTINVLGVGWARGSGIDRVTKEYHTGINDGIPYQAYNYMTAVALKWNLSALAKNKQQYNAAAQEAEVIRYGIDAQTLQLNQQVKNAALQYAYALQQAKVAPVQYKAAQDAYRLSDARYQAGLTPLADVIQAYYVLNRADVDNAIAINNLWRALLEHAAATGNLSELTNQLP